MNEVVILIVVSFIIILITVVIIIGFNGNSFKPATLNQTSIDTASISYNIPSAWSGAQPVRNSTCQVYTFISNANFIAQPSIDQLDLGNTGIQPINGTCTDDDQIFAQKMYHVCKYGEFQDIPPAQFSGCLLVDGSRVKIDGYYEEFFNVCGAPVSSAGQTGAGAFSDVTASTSTRCPGSVGLIMFNFNSSVNGGVCMREPVYTLDGSNIIVAPGAPLTAAKVDNGAPSPNYPDPSKGCNVGETQHGFPSQLFRVTRHTYDGNSFTLDNTGQFLNITHRPTGNLVAPYTLNSGKTAVGITNFIPAFPPILVPANSFNGNGCFWYLTDIMLMPLELIRGVRPDPDPMLPSTIVGGPEWDGLYWLDQRRTANPQLVWAPDPTPIFNLSGDLDTWNYFTSTTSPVYSLVPFVRTGNVPVYSQMSLTPFLTYQILSGTSADDILPLTNPNSIFYPTQQGLIDYATTNAANSSSACYGFNPFFGAFVEPNPGKPGGYILVPIFFANNCYKEYTDFLFSEYVAALTAVEERILSENGSFMYIDLGLYATILGNVGNYFGT